MDIADALLKAELFENGDGRWKYKPYQGERQTDVSIAKRAGCNVSYVSKTRRAKYGQLVPQQSEEALAARRGKPFGRPFQKKGAPFIYPEASAPTREEISIGTMSELHRVIERLARIEMQNRDMMAYLKVLYAAWKPAEAPDDITDLLVQELTQ